MWLDIKREKMPFTSPSSNKWINEIWLGKNVAISARDCPNWHGVNTRRNISIILCSLDIFIYGFTGYGGDIITLHFNVSHVSLCLLILTITILPPGTHNREKFCNFVFMSENKFQTVTLAHWESLVKNIVSEQYKRLDCHNWDNDLHQWGELANF